MRLLAAVAFLTRVPVRRPFDAADVGRGSVFFPLVGTGIGLLQAVIVAIGGARLSHLLVAVLAVAVSAWVTRGLHLDGLADFADGLGGGRDRESVLRVMRDSRIGTFGALALGLVVLAKVAALESLLRTNLDAALGALVLAPTLARWTSVPAGFLLPYARSEGGMGSVLTDFVRKRELAGATVLTGAAIVLVDARLGALAWLTAVVSSGAVFVMARARIGGVTGDVLGAGVEVAEASTLVVMSSAL